MDIFSDPVALGLFGKLVGGIIVFLLVVGFIPGLIIGFLVGRSI